MTSRISQQDRVWFLPSILIPSAYRDRALQHGSLHHSAPNIYARAFAQLKIEPGHAFLNVGSGTFWCSFNKKAPSLEREFSASRMLSCLQVPNHCRVSGGCASVDICAVACFFLFFWGGVKGTGWISCVAGILLGESGINHGVEIYSCVVQFSTRKARKFAAHLSAQATPVPFTKPRFAAGNCYYLDPAAQRYDRIYVGYAKHVKLNGGKIKGGGGVHLLAFILHCLILAHLPTH